MEPDCNIHDVQSIVVSFNLFIGINLTSITYSAWVKEGLESYSTHKILWMNVIMLLKESLYLTSKFNILCRFTQICLAMFFVSCQALDQCMFSIHMRDKVIVLGQPCYAGRE